MKDYEAEILALYEGEAYGVRLFSLLAANEDDARIAKLWERVAEVERVTGECALGVVKALGADAGKLRKKGETRAAAQSKVFENQSGRDIMSYYGERMPERLADLRELRGQARPEHEAMLDQFLRHSEAFSNCVQRWLMGAHAGAMESLDRYIENPRGE